MKYYSYEEFKNDANSLIKKVADFDAEAIVGVARGGLILSHVMAEGLNVREVQTLRTELYDKSLKRDKLSVFDACSFENKQRVLVIDDISDSGETLLAVMNHLKEKHVGVEFKSATLFYKKTSVYEPHFWIKEADDWIDFFWERDYKRD